jgi:hypothetical protein
VNTFNLGISFCNSISSGQNYSDPFFIYVHCYRQSEAYYSRFILLHTSDILGNVEYFKSNLSPSADIGWDFIASLDQRDLLRSVGRKERQKTADRGKLVVTLVGRCADCTASRQVLRWMCWSPAEVAAGDMLQLHSSITTFKKSPFWYGTSEIIRNYRLYVFIMWHVDPLLGNDRERSGHTTAVAK